MRDWVQSIWMLLPHSGRLGQIYVMWDDAATDATEPAGSTPEGELTGKPCSINSNPFWLHSGPFWLPLGSKEVAFTEKRTTGTAVVKESLTTAGNTWFSATVGSDSGPNWLPLGSKYAAKVEKETSGTAVVKESLTTAAMLEILAPFWSNSAPFLDQINAISMPIRRKSMQGCRSRKLALTISWTSERCKGF